MKILKLIFVPLIFTTLTLSLTFYNHLEQIYVEIISNSPDDVSGVTVAFIIVFVSLWFISFTIFFNRECILSFACERQSEKRIDYLPLSDEACQKLGIYNIEDYCDFLNHFLFRRPFGRTYKINNAPLLSIILWAIKAVINNKNTGLCRCFFILCGINTEGEIL